MVAETIKEKKFFKRQLSSLIFFLYLNSFLIPTIQICAKAWKLDQAYLFDKSADFINSLYCVVKYYYHVKGAVRFVRKYFIY